MKPLHYMLIGLFCGLIASAIILLFNLPDRGVPVELNTNSQINANTVEIKQQQITIHIDGQVNKPGLYNLPADSRINDAVKMADGLTEIANSQLVNLASLLQDGQKIYIPAIDESIPEDSSINRSSAVLKLININSADLDGLVSLPGIGTTKAQAIIDYRNEHGPFIDKKDIILVPGIGETILDSIFDLITLGP